MHAYIKREKERGVWEGEREEGTRASCKLG